MNRAAPARQLVLRPATRLRNPELGDWVEREVSFPADLLTLLSWSPAYRITRAIARNRQEDFTMEGAHVDC